jgi:predicted TIM-barrel fold metal-dependent hydrolase
LNTETTFLRSAENAIAIMDELGILKELVMPPPFSNRMPGYEFGLFSDVIKTYPDRFGFLGGGGTLNPILHGAVQAGRVTPEVEQRFENQAREIVAAGAAGFGEIAALHLSFFEGHPFMEAPPDHPLLLLLTDIAAETGIPIELHMEAVPQDMALPKGLSAPPNAPTLKANIAGLENLLNHNPQAKIVWAHAGWDNTGFRTVDLMRDLMAKHPNLYMSIKIAPKDNIGDNIPLDLSSGSVKPEWVDLFSQFPDRFVIGSDVFYGETDDPRATPLKKVKGAWRVVAGIPTDIAYQIACENPLMIYRIIP